MFKAHAEDTGQSYDELWRKFEEMRKAKADAAVKRREELGVLKGEKKDAAIDLCRKELGSLSGEIVFALPGWKTEWNYRQSCNQTHVVYITDESTAVQLGWMTEEGPKSWLLLKDLEAAFGAVLEGGGKKANLVRDIFARGQQDADTLAEIRALGSQAAKSAESGSVLIDPSDPSTYEYLREGGAPPRVPTRDKARDKKKRKRSVDPPVQEVPPMKKVFPPQTGWAAPKTKEEWMAAGQKFRKLLAGRKFPEHTQVLAVQDVSAESEYSAKLTGVYFQKPAQVSGRILFQKLLATPEASAGFCGDGVFLFWTQELKRWQICTSACDAGGKRCYAFANSQDQPADVTKLQGSWQVRRSPGAGVFLEDRKLKVWRLERRKQGI